MRDDDFVVTRLVLLYAEELACVRVSKLPRFDQAVTVALAWLVVQDEQVSVEERVQRLTFT